MKTGDYIWIPSLKRIDKVQKIENGNIVLNDGIVIKSEQVYHSFYEVFEKNKNIFNQILKILENKKNNSEFGNLYLNTYNLVKKIITDKYSSSIASTIDFLFFEKKEKENLNFDIDLKTEKEKINSFLKSFFNSFFSKDFFYAILKSENVVKVIDTLSFYNIDYEPINRFLNRSVEMYNEYFPFFSSIENMFKKTLTDFIFDRLFYNRKYINEDFFKLINMINLENEIDYDKFSKTINEKDIAEAFVFIRNYKKRYYLNSNFYNIANDNFLLIEQIFFTRLLNSFLKDKEKTEILKIVDYFFEKIQNFKENSFLKNFKLNNIFYKEDENIQSFFNNMQKFEKEKTENPFDYIYLLNNILSIGVLLEKISVEERIDIINKVLAVFENYFSDKKMYLDELDKKDLFFFISGNDYASYLFIKNNKLSAEQIFKFYIKSLSLNEDGIENFFNSEYQNIKSFYKEIFTYRKQKIKDEFGQSYKMKDILKQLIENNISLIENLVKLDKTEDFNSFKNLIENLNENLKYFSFKNYKHKGIFDSSNSFFYKEEGYEIISAFSPEEDFTLSEKYQISNLFLFENFFKNVFINESFEYSVDIKKNIILNFLNIFIDYIKKENTEKYLKNIQKEESLNYDDYIKTNFPDIYSFFYFYDNFVSNKSKKEILSLNNDEYNKLLLTFDIALIDKNIFINDNFDNFEKNLINLSFLKFYISPYIYLNKINIDTLKKNVINKKNFFINTVFFKNFIIDFMFKNQSYEYESVTAVQDLLNKNEDLKKYFPDFLKEFKNNYIISMQNFIKTSRDIKFLKDFLNFCKFYFKKEKKISLGKEYDFCCLFKGKQKLYERNIENNIKSLISNILFLNGITYFGKEEKKFLIESSLPNFYNYLYSPDKWFVKGGNLDNFINDGILSLALTEKNIKEVSDILSSFVKNKKELKPYFDSYGNIKKEYVIESMKNLVKNFIISPYSKISQEIKEREKSIYTKIITNKDYIFGLPDNTKDLDKTISKIKFAETIGLLKIKKMIEDKGLILNNIKKEVKSNEIEK